MTDLFREDREEHRRGGRHCPGLESTPGRPHDQYL